MGRCKGRTYMTVFARRATDEAGLWFKEGLTGYGLEALPWTGSV